MIFRLIFGIFRLIFGVFRSLINIILRIFGLSMNKIGILHNMIREDLESQKRLKKQKLFIRKMHKVDNEI